MPEGDTIFRAARTLQRALAGKVVTRFETVLPKLARVDEDAPLAGRTVVDVEARGKWMLMHFSGDLILLTHMLMSGSWHIYRPGEQWQRSRNDMRVVIETSDILAVAFRVPVAEFHTEESLKRRARLNQLGDDLLGAEFDIPASVERLRAHGDLELGDTLLHQSVLAGPGNVFKSEICFACRLDPFRKISSLSEEELLRVATKARELMTSNVSDTSGDKIVTYTGFRRTTGRSDPYERLWVYGRAGLPCRRCGTRIEVKRQGAQARKTYFCPECQR
ncbi:DNA-(apurinic or apyrimidinic site) lyase [Candidatus Koribacter versatilis Ellin345]|uniref:DNA-(apurinic or apyrimidinic site) lyase n=1 Tax=Koribacter versatilis (strain Ellin345) TaxID=204669 RepID=Q1IUR5_KORVE|nr:DNA-formamidopyrimidine glycosylase family protein [Candidatus Koribacter versatilis]ABF39385.1 DNA-(apurinic or apyrimidinic site) lyase [Candidatus Koribacter versatilis Ellin345]